VRMLRSTSMTCALWWDSNALTSGNYVPTSEYIEEGSVWMIE